MDRPRHRKSGNVITRESHWVDGLTFDGTFYRFDGAMDGDTFMKALGGVHRSNGPALLFDMYHQGVIDIADYPHVVAHVWTLAEFPSSLYDPPAMWVALFGDAGYTHDGLPADRPASPVELYRGCHHERRFGMSWTTDRDRAQWFADRNLGAGTGHVYLHRAEPVELLAYIHDEAGRGEAEYVIDPAWLDDDNVRRVDAELAGRG